MHARIQRENPKQSVCYDLSFPLHNFQQAKNDYLQSRDMLRDMMIKHQEARLLFKIPRNPVTIHERAK